MKKNFTDVKAGDELWMLNGHKTTAFEANVIRVSKTEIHVEVPAKGNTPFVFERATGRTPPSVLDNGMTIHSSLAFDGDPIISFILQRKDHGQLHAKVREASQVFRMNPSAENGYALTDAVEEWRRFVVTETTPAVLLAKDYDSYLIDQLVAQE